MTNQPPEFYDPNTQDDPQQWNRPSMEHPYPGQQSPGPFSQQPPYPPQPTGESQQGQYDQPNYGGPASYGQPRAYQQTPYQQTPYQQGSPYAQPGAYQADSYAQNPYVPDPYAPFAGAGTGRPRPSVGLPMAVRLFFKNYAVFSGRASRSEYWWVQLFLGLVYLLWGVLFVIAGGFTAVVADYDPYGTGMATTGFGFGLGLLLLLGVLMYLAVIVPSLAIVWRRFHDTDKSGALYCLSFVPWVGSLIVIILLALPSVPTAWQRWDNGVLPAEG